MKNQPTGTVPTARQQGISLIVSLIMLLIMTVIGISAMNTSVSKIQMSGSIQQQSFISNSTEESLVLGENAANTGTTALGLNISNQSGFLNQANAVDVQDANVWADAFAGADNNSQYFIEYLGAQLDQGDDMTTGNDPNALQDTVQVYRITARSVSGNGTARMFQSLYISANPPPPP